MAKKKLIDRMKASKYLRETCVPEIRRKKEPDVKGSYSYCYYYANYVVLKNIDPFNENGDSYEARYETKRQLLDDLIDNYDINTPRLCAYITGKHHFYELQERAPGSALSIFYPSTARAIANNKGVLGDSHTRSELEREGHIEPYEEEAIGSAMFKYNSQMQSMLKAADQSLFDKFVRDFKILIEQGVSIDSARSENFLFDKQKGFSFVDLAVNDQKQNFSTPSDFRIGQMIYDSFADFTAYIKYMNPNQQKSIIKNMDVIHEKIFRAIKKNKFELNPQEEAYFQQKSTASDRIIKNIMGSKR